MQVDPIRCRENFFVRGLIHLPIIGAAETFRWGVWGSLSRENSETLLKMDDDPGRGELPAMFSWLSTRIPEYPDTGQNRSSRIVLGLVFVFAPAQTKHEWLL